ncbi:methyltransferase [Mycolicibacterium boenickei]
MIARASDRDSLRQLAHGFYFSSALFAAVRLGLPNAIAEGPLSSHELAARLGVQHDPLERLLMFLGCLGVLERDASGAYSLSEVGRHLCPDHPQSLTREVSMFSGGETYRAWGDVLHSVRTGEPAFESVYGQRLFSYLAANESSASRFHEGWQEITTTVAAEAAEAYDFEGLRSIIDVGGGHGIFLATILGRLPALRGVLYDLPISLAGASAVAAELGVSDRLEIVAGDAEVSVPGGSDLFLLKSVIHLCNDARANAILRSCRRAAGAGAKLLVVERVVPEEGTDFHWSRMVDMTMLVMTGGRERTLSEYASLYDRCGFRLTRAVLLPSGFSLIEGERA